MTNFSDGSVFIIMLKRYFTISKRSQKEPGKKNEAKRNF